MAAADTVAEVTMAADLVAEVTTAVADTAAADRITAVSAAARVTAGSMARLPLLIIITDTVITTAAAWCSC